MDGLNPITRREVFLAAASGEQVETPEPITREEMYLKKIAEGGGGSSLPDTPAEDGTYALQNTVSSGTGTLSWASGGSSGGVLVVGVTVESDAATCNKTCKEMWDALKTGVVLLDGGTFLYVVVNAINDSGYSFVTFDSMNFSGAEDNDYPTAILG